MLVVVPLVLTQRLLQMSVIPDQHTGQQVVAKFLLQSIHLLLVTPWLVPVKARRQIRRSLVAEADRTLYPKSANVRTRLTAQLQERGMTYQYLLDLDDNKLVARGPVDRIAREITEKLAERYG